jgi:hypothetical protein
VLVFNPRLEGYNTWLQIGMKKNSPILFFHQLVSVMFHYETKKMHEQIKDPNVLPGFWALLSYKKVVCAVITDHSPLKKCEVLGGYFCLFD